uniref:ATP-dependent DNA helicase n=1 Tax=Octopus bimaculoides TaxID=37653 RepID=A0A0L8GXQ5_OCTBM
MFGFRKNSVVKKLMKHVVEATILSGCRKGEDVFIPRIPLTPSGSDIPFAFRRLQFLLQPSFAMSVNKSQGQTLSVAGLL